MIPRYTLPEMAAVWSDEARFTAMLRVELAVARAQARRGQVPADALAVMERRASVDTARIAELERTTDHDVIAFVSQVAETVGPEGRFLHFGLTSSDVVDTALALQVQAASARLLADLEAAIDAVVAQARRHAATLEMGRTHSVHAEPTTFGLKLAGWALELERDRQRLTAAAEAMRVGKLSGPVGTYSHLDPDLEAEVLEALGLTADPASTQIVQRDRHAAFLATLAVAGGSLERFATEIRNLQHTEIAEVMEPFRTGQKGSSAMPHKRNPILSERLTGLARLLRGYALAGLEDQALWHERDISHSSVERVAIPDATTLLDYMLVRFRRSWPGSSCEPIAWPRTSSAGSACTPRAASCWRSSRKAACRGRPPTRSCSAMPWPRPTSGARCASCWRPTLPCPLSCPRRRSRPASTTPISCATCRRSSPGSTRCNPSRRPWDDPRRRLRPLGQGARPVSRRCRPAAAGGQ